MALEGDIEQKIMPELIDIHPRHAIRVLQKLQDRGLIKFVEAVKTGEPGAPRKVYGLTLQGLIFILAMNTELIDKIENIADKNTELLAPIFNKINYFKKNKIFELLKFRLTFFVVNIRVQIFGKLDKYNDIFIQNKKNLENVFKKEQFNKFFKKNANLVDDDLFFDLEKELKGILMFGTKLEPLNIRRSFLITVGKDVELRYFIFDFLKKKEETDKKQLEETRSWLYTYVDEYKDLKAFGNINNPG
jgi:DNA-binding PadR family transcriptional regulator